MSWPGALGTARPLTAPEDRGLAERLPPPGPRERILRLDPIRPPLLPHEARLDLPHLLAVQELMIHVHQVLVHEAVVAPHFAPEPPRLEPRDRRPNRASGTPPSPPAPGRPGTRRSAPPPHGTDKPAPRSAASPCPDTAPRRRPRPNCTSTRDTRSVSRPRPPTPCSAAPAGAHSDPRAHTPAVLRPHQHDRLPRPPHRQRLPRLQLRRPSHRIPMIRMRPDPAEIPSTGAILPIDRRTIGRFAVNGVDRDWHRRKLVHSPSLFASAFAGPSLTLATCLRRTLRTHTVCASYNRKLGLGFTQRRLADRCNALQLLAKPRLQMDQRPATTPDRVIEPKPPRRPR